MQFFLSSLNFITIFSFNIIKIKNESIIENKDFYTFRWEKKKIEKNCQERISTKNCQRCIISSNFDFILTKKNCINIKLYDFLFSFVYGTCIIFTPNINMSMSYQS